MLFEITKLYKVQLSFMTAEAGEMWGDKQKKLILLLQQ
jgi:hypothetical protein